MTVTTYDGVDTNRIAVFDDLLWQLTDLNTYTAYAVM